MTSLGEHIKCNALTSEIMYPHSPAKQVYVIHQHKKVRSLIDEESVPWLGCVGRIPKHCHADTQLGNNDSNACTDGDPRENVGRSTPVALMDISARPELGVRTYEALAPFLGC